MRDKFIENSVEGQRLGTDKTMIFCRLNKVTVM